MARFLDAEGYDYAGLLDDDDAEDVTTHKERLVEAAGHEHKTRPAAVTAKLQRIPYVPYINAKYTLDSMRIEKGDSNPLG